jgi:hypothetical protein
LYEALPGRILRSTDATLDALVDAQARHRILSLVDELGVPVHAVCYECRLRSGDGRVDVAVCLIPAQPMAIEHVLGSLGRRHLADPSWRRCLEFLSEWSHPASSYAAQIPFACVAFDLPVGQPAVPVPGLSLCIDREFFTRLRGLPAGPPAPVSALVALADDCHRRVRGAPMPAEPLELLERCVSGKDVIAKHVSFMLSRAPAAFKLDIRIPVSSLAALLRRIDWPGPADSVVARIQALAPRQNHVQVNLVLGALGSGLGASLEVELLATAAECGNEERAAILRQLVDGGHCDVAKAEVLLRSSLDPVHRAHDGLIVARNWYLKVKFDEDRIAEAKAYLGVLPRVWARAQRAVDVDDAPRGKLA